MESYLIFGAVCVLAAFLVARWARTFDGRTYRCKTCKYGPCTIRVGAEATGGPLRCPVSKFHGTHWRKV